ncbi:MULTISPECIES: hypothetical protein [unclassified Streptomyces]|uniref:hypothetical protein n=1 Tax=unclassified Streptomyces TaxID=2593676 RepID=UPI0037A83D17
MSEGRRSLVIVERAHRGTVETQFSDTLYSAYLFHRHLGGLDVLLRGPAVTYAARTPRVPPLRLGKRLLTTTNDPREGLRVLLDAGVDVWVEEPDLTAHGLDGETALLPEVRAVGAGVMAARWPDYRAVFYL